MENLFLKRATEYLRDHEAFLSVVSPEPLKHFLGSAGQDGVLYDRLVLLQGTPGSGKTTLASLFEFPRLATVLRNTSLAGHGALAAALEGAGATKDGAPRVLGCRLPLETDYRDIWEFPYPEELRLSLTTALVQARAVLSWMRNIEEAGISLTDVTAVPRADAQASVEAIGGTSAASMLERAKSVERALYRIVGALVPPKLSEVAPEVTAAYRPFDVLERFRIEASGSAPLELVPLVILDDAQSLHPDQFGGVRRWLTKREMKVARWMLLRLDVLNAKEALDAFTEEHADEPPLPGIGRAREVHTITLQASEQRRAARVAFRRMARDMANRYLAQMPLFGSRNLAKLEGLLVIDPDTLSPSDIERLRERVNSSQRRLGVSDARRAALEQTISEYASGASRPAPEDVRLAMLHVLLHRYAKRTPQRDLFDAQAPDPEPARPIVADSTVAEGARLWLFHQFDRAYYFGIEDLCDASSENAEQFLHLAAGLVESIANNIVRGKTRSLSARAQHNHLTKKAVDTVDAWEFPHFGVIRKLVDALAERCHSASSAPNAWLGAGANAYGIPQAEFEVIAREHPRLAHTLQFGVAYNALTLVPRYTCKDTVWCLVELGGIVKVARGLTLKRGGFIEGTATELARILDEVAR